MTIENQNPSVPESKPQTLEDQLMDAVDPSVKLSNAIADALFGITIAGAIIPCVTAVFLEDLPLPVTPAEIITLVYHMTIVMVVGYIAASIAGLLAAGIVNMLYASLKPFLSPRMTLSIFPSTAVLLCVMPFWVSPSGEFDRTVSLLTIFAVVFTHVMARAFGYRTRNSLFRARVLPERLRLGIGTLLKLTTGAAILFALARLIGGKSFYIPLLIYFALQLALVMSDHLLWRIYFDTPLNESA